VAADTTLETALREHGHRVTRPRQLVWDALQSATGHLTAEELTARVHDLDDGVNQASVYRSLELFAELGLARESRLGAEGASRWELAHPDDHFHLVCDSCGEVDHHAGDLVEQLRHHLGTGHGFRADAIELVVQGRCERCASEPSAG
jgi:Fur family ferric uptake transcriptional regulator